MNMKNAANMNTTMVMSIITSTTITNTKKVG